MNRSYLGALAVSALILGAGQAMASDQCDYYLNNPFGSPAAITAQADEDLADLVILETQDTPAVQLVENYEQQAKTLGNKIVDGFKATSPAGWLTSFVASCTKLYAGLVFSTDSITEGYLIKGKETGLNLSDLRAVYNHLTETFAGRITGNVEKGVGLIPVKYVEYAGKALHYGGDKYYNYRLAKALSWVYQQDMNTYKNPELPLAQLEKEAEGVVCESLVNFDERNDNNKSNNAPKALSSEASDALEHISALEALYMKGKISKEEFNKGAEPVRALLLDQVDLVLPKSSSIDDLLARTALLNESAAPFRVIPAPRDTSSPSNVESE